MRNATRRSENNTPTRTLFASGIWSGAPRALTSDSRGLGFAPIRYNVKTGPFKDALKG